jgi:hypothetical protein
MREDGLQELHVRPAVQRLRAGLRRVWHLERNTLLIMVVLVSTVAFLFIWTRVLHHERQGILSEVAAMKMRPDSTSGNAALATHEVSALTIPDAMTAAAILMTLDSTARRLGLSLGEFTSTIDRGFTDFAFVQSIEFQARGRFTAVSEMTAEMLSKHHSLALDSIQVQRISETDPSVIATLQFSVFIKP